MVDTNIIVILLIAAIILLAVLYIVRAKEAEKSVLAVLTVNNAMEIVVVITLKNKKDAGEYPASFLFYD